MQSLVTSPAPGPTMSVWAGTGIVAGSLTLGAITTADMTRLNRSRADVIKQIVVGVSLGEFVIGLAGVLLAHVAAHGDIVAIVAIVTSSIGFAVTRMTSYFSPCSKRSCSAWRRS